MNYSIVSPLRREPTHLPHHLRLETWNGNAINSTRGMSKKSLHPQRRCRMEPRQQPRSRATCTSINEAQPVVADLQNTITKTRITEPHNYQTSVFTATTNTSKNPSSPLQNRFNLPERRLHVKPCFQQIHNLDEPSSPKRTKEPTNVKESKTKPTQA